MKVKNLSLEDALKACNVINLLAQQFTFKAYFSFQILQIRKKLNALQKDYYEQKKDLWLKYGYNETTNFKNLVGTKELEEMEKEHDELLKTNIEIHGTPELKLEGFGDAQIPPVFLEVLEPFLSIEEV
jgi:hypothetical protein